MHCLRYLVPQRLCRVALKGTGSWLRSWAGDMRMGSNGQCYQVEHGIRLVVYCLDTRSPMKEAKVLVGVALAHSGGCGFLL